MKSYGQVDDEMLDLELRVLYVRALRLHCKPESLPSDGLLAALSIDSVSMLEIGISVETKYSIEIDPGDFSVGLLDSFKTLARYILERQN